MAYYYSDLGDFLQAMREERNHSIDRNTFNAWKRINGDVPSCHTEMISDDATQKILQEFAATASGDLANTTISSYSQAFRKGLSRFMQYIDVSGGAELDGLTAWIELIEAKDTPPEPEPEVAEDDPVEEEEDAYDEEPEMTTYKFLLRPGLNIEVPIPDDLTANEVKRFTTWLGTFVISGRR